MPPENSSLGTTPKRSSPQTSDRLMSRKSSLEFWHEYAEIHSLNRGVWGSKLATNGAGDVAISGRDDRVRDQRTDAAQAGLHAGGSSGSQGDRRGTHWQRSDGFLRGAKYIIHDRDPLFSKAFIAILKTGGVKRWLAGDIAWPGTVESRRRNAPIQLGRAPLCDVAPSGCGDRKSYPR